MAFSAWSLFYKPSPPAKIATKTQVDTAKPVDTSNLAAQTEYLKRRERRREKDSIRQRANRFIKRTAAEGSDETG